MEAYNPDHSEHCPFRYSNLVSIYYNEGIRCLDTECFFAAIAVFWAAIDYAIEHELWGGKIVKQVSPGKFEYALESIDFDPRRFKEKLKELFKRYPALKENWEQKLPYAYDLFRNTFIHAKLENITDQPIAPGLASVPHIRKADFKMPREQRTMAEASLMALASQTANSMHVVAQQFLRELNDCVSKITA